MPINAFQGLGYFDPADSENDDVALGRLLLGTGGGARTKIGDKIGQRLWAPGIGDDDGMTGGDQMAAESTRHVAGTDESHFDGEPPVSVGTANAPFKTKV